MSETPAERRERLVAALCGEAGTRRGAEYALDALLAALEPPVAEMVRRGVDEAPVAFVAHHVAPTVMVYRPRAEL